jgi:hypothetical protein
MDVDDGANDKGTDADDSSGTQGQDSSGNRGKEKGEGSGQKKLQSGGPKQNNGASKELVAGTAAGHSVVDDGVFTVGQQDVNSVIADEVSLVFRQGSMTGNVAVQGGVLSNEFNSEQQQQPNPASEVNSVLGQRSSTQMSVDGRKRTEEGSQSGYSTGQNNPGHDLIVSKLHDSVLNGNDSEVLRLEAKSHSGNSTKNFNQELATEAHALSFNNAIVAPNAGHKGQVGGVLGKTQEELQELAMPMITPVKRSKRSEGSVDEDSSARAQRLKAKRNLDAPGMLKVKSFLSFPNAKIKSTITSPGIDCGRAIDIEAGIDRIKEIEHNRLLEAPIVGQANEIPISDEDEILSDLGTDFGLDYNAINYLTGDIAEVLVGKDGSPATDFKPTPKTKKIGSSRQRKAKNKSKNNKKMAFKMKEIFWNSNGLRGQTEVLI